MDESKQADNTIEAKPIKSNSTHSLKSILDSIRWNQDGLIPAIAQSDTNHQVLMLAWVNKEALTQTLKTSKATYFSRSRNKIWVKGEESGHIQHIKKVTLDCDLDTVLYTVEQKDDIACHTGRETCFFQCWNETENQFEITLPVKKKMK